MTQVDQTEELASLFMKLDGNGQKHALQLLRGLERSQTAGPPGENGLPATAGQAALSLEPPGVRPSDGSSGQGCF